LTRAQVEAFREAWYEAQRGSAYGEPWTTSAEDEVLDAEGHIVVDPYGCTLAEPDDVRAMRRIVACVNHCAGVPTEALCRETERAGAGGGDVTPVSPVMPGSASIEIVLGEGQPEYVPLPAVYLDTRSRPMITRWRLSDEERAMVASGADVVLQQLTFRCLVQPVNLQIVMPDGSPVFVEEP
jgi:hypothetical protein